jgi:hypothetical protein
MKKALIVTGIQGKGGILPEVKLSKATKIARKYLTDYTTGVTVGNAYIWINSDIDRLNFSSVGEAVKYLKEVGFTVKRKAV